MNKRAQKAPKTRCDGTMSESEYLTWIRSALRSKSLRWPPRNNALLAARVKYVGSNTRRKWSYVCAICNNLFENKQVVVDHHPHAAGSIKTVQDIGPFAERLYCDRSNLRVLCKNCHDIHTLSQTHNISFEEAKIEKKIVAAGKLKIKELDDMLKRLNIKIATKMSKPAKLELLRKELYGSEID